MSALKEYLVITSFSIAPVKKLKTKQKVTAKERQVVNSDDDDDEEEHVSVADEYEDVKQCK